MTKHILDAGAHRTREGGASFPIGHRVKRAFWNATWLALASWTPAPFHPWRRLLLRLFGAKIAPTSTIYGSAHIWYPPNLEVGQYATIGPRANVYCMARVRLEEYAVLSQGAHICAGSHDISDAHFQLVAKPIVVGARAWIAAEAFVGPGVTVGEGAVLAARGVAFRDLEPWTVYVGNPASVTKRRAEGGLGR